MKKSLFLAMVLAFGSATHANEPAAKPAAAPAATEKAAEKPAEKTADKKAEKADKKDKMTKEAKTSALPKDLKTLITEDMSVGTGKVATKGKMIKVNYTGWIYDPKAPKGQGKQFDTSIGRTPFSFTLGAGQVIKGWDEGFKDMKVGGKRRILIPSEMGYGARGAGDAIKPNQNLIFEVELLDVMDSAAG